MCSKLSISSLIAVFSIAAMPAYAQCGEWATDFSLPGTSTSVTAMVAFDDGGGPALYVGASVNLAGGVVASNIAKWDGASWSALDTGTNGPVKALAVYDDGSGPALYAGGEFTIAGGVTVNHVAKWDGIAWSALSIGVGGASPPAVRALAVYDDGAGAKLYAGGVFTSAGGSPASRIARWNGSTWSSLGSGLNAYVAALAVYDDGSGPALYAGGGFDNASGLDQIAKWNGTSWSSLAGGMDGISVTALAVHDDGSGPALYAGGTFDEAGPIDARNIAKWNGSSWSALGSGLLPNSGVFALTSFDDGAGAELYVGGNFGTAGATPARSIAKWDGSGWSALDGELINEGDPIVFALCSFDAGDGVALYVGGQFYAADDVPASNLARWSDANWSSVEPVGHGIYQGYVFALAHFDDGSGDAVYAGGNFLLPELGSALQVTKWNGASWSAVGDPLTAGIFGGSVRALATFDDGAGVALYAGGHFTEAGAVPVARIAKWDGASWSPLGTGLSGDVSALCVWNDGTGDALYVGGGFTMAGGGSATNIAKWDGTSWSALGAGIGGGVRALAVFDDGTGEALYVGGGSANHIARWNGSSWSSVGAGLGGDVQSLAVFDDGSGPALYAGGTVLGGTPQKWNGSTWSLVGGGANNDVSTLRVFDDGTGDKLYAGGAFTTMGGNPANYIATWNGSTWSALGDGMNYYVFSLLGFQDGADGAADLYAGGWFDFAGGVPSSRFAELFGCEPGAAYCFGDGIDSVVTAACPCSNFGDAGRGCANSNALLGGARLFSSGTTSPNTLLFTCDGIPNNTFCTFLRSSASDDTGFVFGDGIKCLNGTGIRFGSQNAGQGGNPANTVISATATVPTGNTRYYQLHYRNPNAGFCPPELFNISNGYRVSW